MGHIIGIDLGTCNSAVVVPEPRSGKGFYTLSGYPGCAVVVDRFQRKTIPSVLALDDGGRLIVGHAAKARAGMAPAPIMFAKRSMGEAVTFDLGSRKLTPLEVSAEVLRHLKKMAEEQLGEPVEEAVITVPAYFSLKAKQMTEQAAIQAGLKVAQIVPEPIAAAIMYCATDPRDPLQVMTYDLGGGTFDVAIIEKKNGQITIDSIKASDGDRFLGGYNFDKALAFWIAEQLRAREYDLDLNLERAGDRVIFSKLMAYAERAKIELSKNEFYELVEPSTGIVDHAGNPISVDLTITRAQFEEMISKWIDASIDICRRACEQARPPVTPDQLHEILMVGGSSQIPCVAKRLEAEFGRVPKLIEPDLCVAMGAGIIAATHKRTRVGNCLELDTLPTETLAPTFLVTGRVTSPERSAAQCRVLLRATDGGFRKEVAPKDDGRFVVGPVPLAKGVQTDFILSVSAGQGPELAVHRFSVTQKAAGGSASGTSPNLNRPSTVRPRTNFLAKPIVVVWYSGPEIIAPALTPLPYNTVVGAKTTDLSGRIRLEIREDNTPLGEILMENVPKTLPVGSEVEVTLDIRQNYVIEAKAQVKALAKEASVQINIPPRPVKTLAELERECQIMTAKVDDALRAAGTGALFGNRTVGRLRDRLAACQEMLRSPAPEAPAIQDCLDEIQGLLRSLTARWNPEPSRDAFDETIQKAWQVYRSALQKKPEMAKEGVDRQIEALVKEAEEAYAKQNPAAWKQSCERLQGLIQDLERKTEGPGSLPPPPILKLQCLQELLRLEEWARKEGVYQKNQRDFEQASESLKAIDVSGPENVAVSKLVHWYQTVFMELQTKLRAPAGDGVIERNRTR